MRLFRPLSRPTLFVGVILATPLLFSGCDPAESNVFNFDVDGVRFTFAFLGNQAVGQTAQVSAVGMENLLDDIQAEGFSATDVTSIRLKSGTAQVRILVAPAGQDIGVLDEVELALTGGGSSVTVASQTDFDSMTGSMAGEADLDVTSANIASIASGGPIGATLSVRADDATPNANYSFETRFDVTVSVEGF